MSEVSISWRHLTNPRSRHHNLGECSCVFKRYNLACFPTFVLNQPRSFGIWTLRLCTATRTINCPAPIVRLSPSRTQQRIHWKRVVEDFCLFHGDLVAGAGLGWCKGDETRGLIGAKGLEAGALVGAREARRSLGLNCVQKSLWVVQSTEPRHGAFLINICKLVYEIQYIHTEHGNSPTMLCFRRSHPVLPAHLLRFE